MMVPAVLAVVICDAVWRDPDTGKATVLGAFLQVVARDLPAELSQLCVYFQMSGHQGWATIRVELFRTDDDEQEDGGGIPLATAEVSVHFADRATAADAAVTMYNVDLPAFGEYHFVLSVTGVPLEQRRIWLISTE